MLQALIYADTFLWLIALIATTLYAMSLRRRLKGMNEPVLLLPRRERRKWAREELARRQFDRDLGIIQGNTHQGETT